VGHALNKGNVKVNDVILKWGGGGKAAVGREEWLGCLEAIGVECRFDEADAFYDSLLVAMEEANPTAIAPTELELKRLSKMVFEYAREAKAEQKALSTKLNALQAEARKLQDDCSHANRRSFVRKRTAAQKEEERAREEAEAAEAAEAEKAAKAAEVAAKKAAEKAAFEAKVNAKRRDITEPVWVAAIPAPEPSAEGESQPGASASA
jgi:pyruvate/2-oxoglutarate dehydrogenase complex dihydrolipoamide acyltransferase (E2) component